jgi:CubicO group peptidase (beta-lactamase class C family)
VLESRNHPDSSKSLPCLSGLFCATALIIYAALPSGTVAERVGSPSVQDIQQSLRFVPDHMAHDHGPGLRLACIHNGTVEWAQAFGVARVGGEPLTPETLFQASSISIACDGTGCAATRGRGAGKTESRR